MVSHTSQLDADVRAVLDGIRRIVQSLHGSSRESERRVGLSAAKLFVLRMLGDSDGLTINELAARTFTHQSSVSVVVSRLESRRLVTRRVHETDARRRLITLTAAGKRVLDAGPAGTQEQLIGAVRQMTPALRHSAARALGQIADAMAAERRPQMFLEEGGKGGKGRKARMRGRMGKRRERS